MVDVNNNIEKLGISLSESDCGKIQPAAYFGYPRSIHVAMIGQGVESWTWTSLCARCKVWSSPFMETIDLPSVSMVTTIFNSYYTFNWCCKWVNQKSLLLLTLDVAKHLFQSQVIRNIQAP